ncbi:tetratricopeptide repeat-containing sulfotransferase family protein [Novosphingobium sp.]|uniref:tetratricopeptide repeat-containing sulfotransferase family protein n=1 Tax=Novosphingobium sp. TaxID=1874826 RepID=UPI0038BB2C3C
MVEPSAPAEAPSAYAEAIARQTRLVAARPADVDARLSLGLMHYRAGQLDLSAHICGQVRALAPDHPGGLWLEARLACDARQWERARPLLERTLAANLSPDQRAETLLLLGDALDGTGEYEAALAAAVAGKAILRQQFAPIAAQHEGEAARYRRLGAWFSAHDLPPADPACVPPAPARHVFLLGFPRSGTTLLEQVLAGHPHVRTLEEAPTLLGAQRAFLNDAEGCARLCALDAAGIAEWRARYWHDVRAMGGLGAHDDPRTSLFIDKAPAGTQWLPLISRLFPDARVLFALRDPRSVVLSCVRSAFAMNAMTYAFCTMADAAQCYAASMEMATVFRAGLALPVMDVRHEAFVADPVAGLAEVSAFLGLEPDPAMLDVAATMARRVVQTPSAPQLRGGISTRGLGHWRRYEKGLQPVLPVLQPWIDRLGYEPS